MTELVKEIFIERNRKLYSSSDDRFIELVEAHDWLLYFLQFSFPALIAWTSTFLANAASNKMDEREHASINIENLADSLRGKIESLHPISKKCCIYRIPERIRRLNERACIPQAVSIGPFHYGRGNLKAMEEHKIGYLRDFLQRTKVRMEDFLIYIKDREVELRECYEEIINLGSDEFVKMILVDAVFIIELLLRLHNPMKFAPPSVSMGIDIMPDVWMLENQLPMFILKGLFDLAMSATSTHHYEGISMCKLAYNWLNAVLYYAITIGEDLLETYFSEANHLLDWLRICLQPPVLSAQNEKIKNVSTPTITELEQAGMKFKLGINRNIFDIRYSNGILEIPKMLIVSDTESLFINLLAFEQLKCYTNYTNDYIVIINQLVNTRKDEEILIRNGVLENFLRDKEGGTALFLKLGNQSYIFPNEFYYSDLVEQLNAYCNTPWFKWKAALKQNYFNTPWASISVIAAVILLILTFIQAVCSIIAL